MESKLLKSIKNKINLGLLLMCLFSANMIIQAQVPDPDRGLRADWMRGSLGLLWLPENNYNGNIEGVSMDDFLDQISHLKTIDFIQVGLASPYIYSPVHTAPHPILESLWQGDTDVTGNPVNLVVPRSTVADPFLGWLESIRAAGLKTEVYVNSSNLLQWIGEDTPDAFPDFSNRWKAYCDTDPTVQAFINSQDYHTDGVNDDRRPYMFAYAEFILKEYAVRYGDLIDAWCFDAAHVNMGAAGDDYSTGNLDDQRIFQAFTNAVHAGNPDAAVTFNNGVGDRDSDPFIPYVTPTLFEDYKFGHPFGGAGNMVEPREPLYRVNFGICEYMRDTNGLPYTDDGIEGNDNVVAHFFPKQSTTSWNAGNTPCLTDEEFVEWNNVGLINGGGITWGTPLVITNLNNNTPNLTLQPYALSQLELVDADLSVNQYPEVPNWARFYTILPEAYLDEPYTHTLVEGVDFWDPEGVGITSLLALDNFPAWLTIEETEPGVWTLGGNPTETTPTDYEFRLQIGAAASQADRLVSLRVIENSGPNWIGQETILPTAYIGEPFSHNLVEDVNFSDPDGDAITSLLVVSGDVSPSWLAITETEPGTWTLSGIPTEATPTDYEFGLLVSDAASGNVRTVALSVVEYEVPTTIDVEIKASENTNYGINEIATMFSEVITAPDGVATFKVSIAVTPQTDKAIFSGESGGPTTINSWGIGEGTGGIQDNLFGGNDNEWVESINDIQIVDFNANGGTLTVEDITAVFTSITIVNSQSPNDFVSFKVGDVILDHGRSSNIIETIGLELITSETDITDFAVGVGNASATNKWSVEGITVTVDFEESTLSILDPEIGETSFRMYPNPATTIISLNMPIKSAKIIDISGRVVKTHVTETESLDVSGLTSGIYILKGMTTEGVQIMKRFIKETHN